MPLTFPSHLAAVLPLKLWAPRRFDGVALAAGAVAPDIAYLTMGTPVEVHSSHSLPALLWWCLPVAVLYTWVFRRVIPAIAVYLPGVWARSGGAGQTRYAWWITASSALLGAASHIGWDWLTHTDGWIRALFGIDWYPTTGVAWWTVSDLSSTLLGGVVAIVLIVRLLRGGDPAGQVGRAPTVRPLVFWTVVSATALVGIAVVPFLPASGQLGAGGVRLLHVPAVALLTGALVVVARRRRENAGQH